MKIRHGSAECERVAIEICRFDRPAEGVAGQSEDGGADRATDPITRDLIEGCPGQDSLGGVQCSVLFLHCLLYAFCGSVESCCMQCNAIFSIVRIWSYSACVRRRLWLKAFFCILAA